MFDLFLTSINKWNATKSERQKLQHVYLVSVAVIVLVAGVASLFNGTLGHNIVKLALLALVVFAVNAISWNLLKSSLLDKLASKPKQK